MPGSKISVVHTEDARAIECLSRVELLQPCSPIAQDFAVNFLSDLGASFSLLFLSDNLNRKVSLFYRAVQTSKNINLEWLEMYHRENIRRLGEQCKLVQNTLTKMGIPFAPCTAGFYIYMNFEKVRL